MPAGRLCMQYQWQEPSTASSHCRCLPPQLGSSHPTLALSVILWPGSCSMKPGTCFDAKPLPAPCSSGRIWPQRGPAKRSSLSPSFLTASLLVLSLSNCPWPGLGLCREGCDTCMHQLLYHLESDSEVINPHGTGWAEAQRATVEHPRDTSAWVAAGCSASSLTPIPATITIQKAIREELKDN